MIDSPKILFTTFPLQISGAIDDCCHFPFEYEGVTFNQCTKVNHDKLWCATLVDAAGKFDGKWKNCDENCKKGEYIE